MVSFGFGRVAGFFVRSTQYLVLRTKRDAVLRTRRAGVGLASLVLAWAVLLGARVESAESSPGVKIATFDVDATPPIGSMMAYDKVVRQDDLPLRCRGVVLIGAGEPIVLCAVDWIGLANEGHDVFRETIAKAAGTTSSRVAVHSLHQHDAPDCDFTAEKLLKEVNATELGQFNGDFPRQVLARVAAAVKVAVQSPQNVTHVGWGEAEVQEVASNRRVMGPDGKVKAVRYTATKDAALRAEPIGTIDPAVSLVSFWNGDKPVAVLSYYACHPQSYYRTGIPNPDFPGIARFVRGQAVPEALHVHFNGAGGNIGAGKFNDGSKDNRVALAMKLADGMARAWQATTKKPIIAGDVGWKTVPVSLPVAAYLDEAKLRADMKLGTPAALMAATRLGFVVRAKSGHKIDLSCLNLGDIRVLHMPGELFVEYQLAAKKMRPDLHVAMAAYGDYGTAYIGMEIAYSQGGYETEPRSSNVAPNVEGVLREGMRGLLEVK
jgi:hypothetical protein